MPATYYAQRFYTVLGNSVTAPEKFCRVGTGEYSADLTPREVGTVLHLEQLIDIIHTCIGYIHPTNKYHIYQKDAHVLSL